MGVRTEHQSHASDRDPQPEARSLAEQAASWLVLRSAQIGIGSNLDLTVGTRTIYKTKVERASPTLSLPEEALI